MNRKKNKDAGAQKAWCTRLRRTPTIATVEECLDSGALERRQALLFGCDLTDAMLPRWKARRAERALVVSALGAVRSSLAPVDPATKKKLYATLRLFSIGSPNDLIFRAAESVAAGRVSSGVYHFERLFGRQPARVRWLVALLCEYLEGRGLDARPTPAAGAAVAERERRARESVGPRTRGKGVVLVYRTPYEDPSCKRVVKLDGGSVLEWFQRGWDAARAWRAADGDRFALDEQAIRWLTKVARGYVHGLESVFAAAREHGLPAPADTKQLGNLLREYLYTEGRTPVVDSTSVRVMTDNDELELAYYLMPLTEARQRPERTAWLLHPGWKLPTRPATRGTFRHGLKLPAIEPAGERVGSVFVVDLTPREGVNLSDLGVDRAVRALQGVRVADLADYLRAAIDTDDWPRVLLGLRAALEPGEQNLRMAVARCLEHGTDELAAAGGGSSYEEARVALKRAGRLGKTNAEARGRSRSACSRHLLQLSRWSGFAFQQWFIFDDRWAIQHPDLARSLLRYGLTWDPLV